jgi:soluble lytic murein transglycosylase-like protein
VSGVGASGLCQAMPATFKDWARDLRWGDADPHVARYCIEGGSYYMAQLRNFPDWRGWADPDRQRASQGAYNAGAGNIRKALRAGSGKSWSAIAAALPKITGMSNAKQTTDYVRLIAQWRRQLGDAPAAAVIVCAWTDHRGGCAPAR